MSSGWKRNVLQEVEGLLEPGGKEIAALRRQRAHKKFEAGGGAEAVLKIGRRHGEFVKIREQGRMAKGFGHEEASGEIIEVRGCGNKCGHTTLPSSYSAGVRAFENGLLRRILTRLAFDRRFGSGEKKEDVHRWQ